MKKTKPDEIILLENLYNVELEEIENPRLFGNNNTYILDENNQVIELNLSGNHIEHIFPFEGFPFLRKLDLSKNNITEIKNLDSLELLEELKLNNNQITKIENLSNEKLNVLDLSVNKIENIEGLESLKYLKHLILSGNEIKVIQEISHLTSLLKLHLDSNKILEIDNLYELKNLISLKLGYNKITKIKNLHTLLKIEELQLRMNDIEEIEGLENCINLKDLDISFNRIEKIEKISQLKRLEHLSIDGNKIEKIENIDVLKELKYLWIGYNKLQQFDINFNMDNLEFIHISGNRINRICNHQNIPKIRTIYAKNNLFENLNSFKEFSFLKKLEIEENNILEVKNSDLIFLKKLDYLEINNNPFVDLAKLKLERNKNHKDAVINYILMNNDFGEPVENPVKVLFLGNHSSGKSTFANYFISEDAKRKFKKVKGTHILNIYNYKEDSNGFPKALIYDFGGQDYYHGIYKAFLSSDCISVLFWQGCNDQNKTRLDTNNLLTQDFSKMYWLYQLKYYNQNSIDNKYEVIVTQTHANKENEKRKTIGNATESLHVSNEFFVELSNDVFKFPSSESSLNYFENTLIELIKKNQIKEKKPKWYIDFLKYIYKQDSHESVTLDSLKGVYNRDKDLSMKYLPTVLDQLHKYGKVIYFKDNEKLKDIVWLNPAKTVEYIHQKVLNKRLINKHNGILEKETFENSVKNPKILELLIENKVIFLDETISETPKYIIPGYLPLVKKTQENYFILSDFSDCNFILKFRNFIPFGFMNRLVCYYGKNPEVKHYWRDQIIFTSKEQKAKINVKLDFENLEIRVTIKPLTKNVKISDIEQDVFADLLSFYFDLDLFYQREEYNMIRPYKDYLEYLLENYGTQLPEDMHLSIDGNWYINFKELQNKTENFPTCVAYNKELNKEKPNIKRSIDYKNFTTNKNINKMKKIFISYSNKDYKFLEKLETHLSPFSDLEIIETWDCTQLRTGYWHKQIQDKLKEADIVIFMLSPDFLASKYILNEELLPSFREFRNDGNKKLMFVVVRNFAYNVLSKFSDLTGEIDLSESKNVLLELTKHQFIPYQKPKGEGTERKLLPIKQWEDEDDAYVEVINQHYENIR